MTNTGPKTPDDIVGINDAEQALGLNRDCTNEEIESAFQTRIQTAEGETYWMLVKAREVGLADSVPSGTAVYEFLRQDPIVSDVASLQDAADLFGTGSPAWDRRDTLGSYDRIVKKQYELLRDRLKMLRTKNRFDVDSDTLQTVDVCYHALRFRDLTEGKQWVLGPDAESENKTSTRVGPQERFLVTGWKYSIERESGDEYYISVEKDAMICITERSSETAIGYEVFLRIDDIKVDSAIHSRYGNAKRQAKRWILELSDKTTD